MPRSVAIHGVFERQQRGVLRLIRHLIGDPQTAEDIVQEAFLRTMVAQRNHPEGIDHVDAYLYRTARNLAMDHLRRRSVATRVEVDAPAPEETIAAPAPAVEDILASQQRLRLFREALNRLPPRARRTLIMARVEGLPTAEIARRLEVSPRTVLNDLKLALDACQDHIRRSER